MEADTNGADRNKDNRNKDNRNKANRSPMPICGMGLLSGLVVNTLNAFFLFLSSFPVRNHQGRLL